MKYKINIHNRIYSWFIIFIIISSVLLLSNYFAQAETEGKLGEKKAKLFQSLAKEKVVEGFDISMALYLDKKSQIAAKEGNIGLASNLLDNAIKALNNLPEKPPIKRIIELPVKSEKVVVTESIPKYEQGPLIKKYETMFNIKTVIAKDGIAKLEITSTPVYVEEGSTTSIIKEKNKDSPFGSHPANTYKDKVERTQYDWLIKKPPHEFGFDYQKSLDIGVAWHRPEVYAFWLLIQKTDSDIEKGLFDWGIPDYIYGTIPKSMNILANIGGIETRVVGGGFPPLPRTFKFTNYYESKYKYFIKKLVERYDGDGVDDIPNLKNPVKYWQLDNEPDFSKDWEGYAHLLEITYKTIKESCNECKVAIGGMASYVNGFDNFYVPIFKKLNGKYIDIFDFHLYGEAWYWLCFKDIIDQIKKQLIECGYDKAEIWVTETGTYSGKPEGVTIRQTEREQAESLIKRYVYALSLGIRKIFWAFGLIEGLADTNSDFDHMGLIYDGKGSDDLGYGEKKLAYYTYKMMTEKLEGSDFSNIKSLNLGEGIFAYKFNKSGKPIYVIWAQ